MGADDVVALDEQRRAVRAVDSDQEAGNMTHYVILGSSAGGLTAIDAIRARDKSGPITMITKEPDATYSRVALPYILSKEKNLRQITLQEPGYFKANNAELVAGVGASGVDPQQKRAGLDA